MSQHNGDDHSREELEAAQLTAYALGQLAGEERAAVEAKFSASGDESIRNEAREIEALAAALKTTRGDNASRERSSAIREAVVRALAQAPAKTSCAENAQLPESQRSRRQKVMIGWAVAASALIAIMLFPAVQSYRATARRMQSNNVLKQIRSSFQDGRDDSGSIRENAAGESGVVKAYAGKYPPTEPSSSSAPQDGTYQRMMSRSDPIPALGYEEKMDLGNPEADPAKPDAPRDQAGGAGGADDRAYSSPPSGTSVTVAAGAAGPPRAAPIQQETQRQRLERLLAERGSAVQGEGGAGRNAAPGGPPGPARMPGGGQGMAGGMTGGYPFAPGDEYNDPLIPVGGAELKPRPKAALRVPGSELSAATAQARNDAEVEVAERAVEVSASEYDALRKLAAKNPNAVSETQLQKFRNYYERTSGEQYEPIIENAFLAPTAANALSTFSIDVDTASYANVRRFLTSGRLPPRNSVRIEELVNYFRYDYPQPRDGAPFSVNMEMAQCPWREGHLLLRVGLKGKEVQRAERPQSNLVFLLDVSGSMADQNKLPLLKTAMKLLVAELGENDRVSIVTYAGYAGLRLPPTRGHERAKIAGVIDSLSAGGSTNGSAGIELAYEQATSSFVEGGTNRVILCTDGDLNVGVTSDEALVELIKKKAAGGTFLTVLGFGEGNLKDAKMEKLADNGNGMYAYIDSVREAKKVLVEQLTGSTITIAKDVKIQIEFNPAAIAAYRLLGYENRVMAAQDFNNDKKDAGEIGAGHTVTALYELVPVGAESEAGAAPAAVDALKYQQPRVQGSGFRVQEGTSSPRPQAPSPSLTAAAASGELLTLKLRYKEPDGETSRLLEYPLKDRGHSFNSASPDMQFAAAVASFGMILRGSEHRGSSNLAAVAEIASGALSSDAGGYRAEFVDLVRRAQGLGAK
jgi:Ca-activated chloride channel homolog